MTDLGELKSSLADAIARSEGIYDENGEYTPILDSDDERVQPYNFYHQEIIERVRLRPLEAVLETVAHRISNALAGALRQPVVIEVHENDQISWEEFVQTLPDPTFVTSALTYPIDGRMLIHLPVPLALQILDCYLGGDGYVQPERDQLTDIERVFMAPLLEETWSALATGFSSTVELRLGLIQSAPSAMNLPIGRAADMCWVIAMQIQIAENRPHTMHLCMAVTWVLPNLEQIEAEQASGVVEERPDYRDAQQRLLAIPVEMRLCYPPITLTTTELLGLAAGDVVTVREGTPEETAQLDLVTGEILIGTGILVEKGNKLACTVVSKTEEYA